MGETTKRKPNRRKYKQTEQWTNNASNKTVYEDGSLRTQPTFTLPKHQTQTISGSRILKERGFDEYDSRTNKKGLILGGILSIAVIGLGVGIGFALVPDVIIRTNINKIDKLSTNHIFKTDLDGDKIYTFVGEDKKIVDVTDKLLYSNNEFIPPNVKKGYTSAEITNNGYKRVNVQDLDGVNTDVVIQLDLNNYRNLSDSILKSNLDLNNLYTFSGIDKTPTEATSNLLYIAENNNRPTILPSTMTRGYTKSQIEAAGYVRPIGTTDLNGILTPLTTQPDIRLYHLKTDSHLITESNLRTESFPKTALDLTKVYTVIGTTDEDKALVEITDNVLYTGTTRPTTIPSSVARGYTKTEIENAGYITTPTTIQPNGINVNNPVSTLYNSKTDSVAKTDLGQTKIYTFTGTSKTKNDVTDKLLYQATTANVRPTDVPSGVARGYTSTQIQDVGYVRQPNVNDLNGITTTQLSVSTDVRITKTDLSENVAYTFVGDVKTPTDLTSNLLYIQASTTGSTKPDVPSALSRGYTKAEIEAAGLLTIDSTTGLNGVDIPTFDTSLYYLKSESILITEAEKTHIEKVSIVNGNKYLRSGNTVRDVTNDVKEITNVDEKLKYFSIKKVYEQKHSLLTLTDAQRSTRFTGGNVWTDTLTYLNYFLPSYAQLTTTDFAYINANPNSYSMRMFITDRSSNSGDKIYSASTPWRDFGRTEFIWIYKFQNELWTWGVYFDDGLRRFHPWDDRGNNIGSGVDGKLVGLQFVKR